jgi:hypothetical protein
MSVFTKKRITEHVTKRIESLTAVINHTKVTPTTRAAAYRHRMGYIEFLQALPTLDDPAFKDRVERQLDVLHEAEHAYGVCTATPPGDFPCRDEWERVQNERTRLVAMLFGEDAT